MNKKTVILVGGLIFLAVLAGLFLVITPNEGAEWRVEVVQATSVDTDRVLNFSDLSETEQQQFVESIGNPTRFESRPEIADHTSDVIERDGVHYRIVVMVP